MDIAEALGLVLTDDPETRDTLTTALEEVAGWPHAIRRVSTFAHAGLLTRDRGVVVEFVDGTEVQMTFVVSRRA